MSAVIDGRGLIERHNLSGEEARGKKGAEQLGKCSSGCVAMESRWELRFWEASEA